MSVAEDIFHESLRFVLSDDEEILRNYRPVWLTNGDTGRALELDFYLPRLRVAFEIQGPHHYGDAGQDRRDELKRELCKASDVILFCMSVIQLKPALIRRKLISCYYDVSRLRLKTFDVVSDEWRQLNARCNAYRSMTKGRYGSTTCQVSPQSNRLARIAAMADTYLKHQRFVTLVCRGKEERGEYLRYERPRFFFKRKDGTVFTLRASYFASIIEKLTGYGLH